MNAIRRAIESQYKGKCDVYEYRNVKDPITKITEQKEVLVYRNWPCKLSYEKINSTNQSTGIAEQSMSTKLFISPDIEIKAGSKIVVTQNGVTTSFSNSGMPGRFTNHQEIMLEMFERWS